MTLILAQVIAVFGFALWSTLAFINNISDFKGFAHAVGVTMSMALLDQQPAIPTPLRRRAITNPALAKAALGLIALWQLATAILFWLSGVQFLLGEAAMAKGSATLALAALTGLCFGFLLGGMWFAYWIRQDALQLSHIGLLIASLAATVLMQL
ncbi:DUF2165 family protein [Phreatobacter stygius]|uniref:DUF2165 domain-containing protein n=1 Tax=Phreatobacter stygius TaxID=1940610 RepID=A0A4D7BCP0_9HYPH|nr:DUF2165 family protein [Phreatobacter stygius]QCI68455.1 DUF2165 domain-containing protein [Phreatobacter stygius]